MKMNQRETGKTGVMRACLDLLEAERIWHRRWNVGAVKLGKRFVRFGQKGDADILASFYKLTRYDCGALHGDHVMLWIETKRPGGRITAEQLAFADEVRERGHQHLFVDDPKQLQDWLKQNRAGKEGSK